MPLSISTNIASLTAQRSFINSNSALETAYERLATGKRINGAGDDPAGLAIGTDLSARVSGLNQAVRNVNDGISMVQIMDGAYDEVTSILQRMRDMAVQAANGSLSSTERAYLNTEQSQLLLALNSALDQATMGGVDLVTNGVRVRLLFSLEQILVMLLLLLCPTLPLVQGLRWVSALPRSPRVC